MAWIRRKRVRESSLDAVESGRVTTGHDIASLEELEKMSRDDPTVYKREKPLQQYPAFMLGAKSAPSIATNDKECAEPSTGNSKTP